MARYALMIPLLLRASMSALPVMAQGGRHLYVAANVPAASDANDGTRERPLKTIGRAAQMVEPGDTVWIDSGVYRETVLVERSGDGPERMIAFRALPGASVVVKGSEPIAGWTRVADEPDRAIYQADWPFGGIYPGMIGVDDQPLIPLSIPAETEALKPPNAYCQYFLGFGRGREAMVPGSFFYDEPRRKLQVWLKGDEDPNQHAVEAAIRPCWDSRANYILVEGITFRYSPLVVPIGGVAFVMTGPGGGMSPAEGCIVRDCDVSLSAFEGMVVRGGREVTTVVEDCWIHHNGNGAGSFEGMALPGSDSWLIVRRTRLTDNNVFNWNQSWHCGGKHFGRRVLFTDCEFARAYNAPGLWFDIHTRDMIVDRCRAHQSGGFGLYYEIGETGAFINNVVQAGPHVPGIGISGSSRTLVAHNYVEGSSGTVFVGGSGVVDGRTSRVACYNTVRNNVLVGLKAPVLNVALESDLTRGNTSDGNILWLKGGTAEDALTAPLFTTGAAEQPAMGLTAWQALGRDASSRVIDPLAELRNGRLVVQPESPAHSGGLPLTVDDLRALFAVRDMPDIPEEAGSSSVRDHEPPSEAFLAKLAGLLRVEEGGEVPVGPLPDAGGAVEQLAVSNAGFEEPDLGANAMSDTVPGWRVTGDADTRPAIWHAADTGLWNWYMPSGSNVLILPAGQQLLGVAQTLDRTLQPGTRYVLSVWVGRPVNQADLPWTHVILALWAGDRLLKAVDVPDPKIHPHYGVWIENVVAYTAPADIAPGEPLRIIIDRVGPARASACFDEVTLSAEPD